VNSRSQTITRPPIIMAVPTSLFDRLRHFGVTEDELAEPVLCKPSDQLSFSTSLIRKELECPICLRIMREPVISRSCGHVYCKECIEKYIRQDKLSKKCPSCRIPITNRRHLVREPILEHIIKTAFPDLEGYLKREEDVIMKVAKKREVQEAVAVPVPSQPVKSADDKVDFQFHPDPDSSLPPLSELYVRVSAQCQVATLLKLLQQLGKPGEPAPKALAIRLQNGEKIQLVKEMRLREVRDFWPAENEDSWVIYYS